MENFYYKSPVGILEIICENNVLESLKIIDSAHKETSETDFIKNIKLQLDEYFSGKRRKFDVKIQPQGTEFQKKVWNALLKIPYGETRTYYEIAKIIGKPKAQRAVGSACNKNPIMIIIPCHRVVSKNGNIGGFAYGGKVKQRLINIENVN